MDLVDKPALTTVFGVLFGWPNRLQTVNLLRPPTNFHSNAIPLTGRHADSHAFPPPPLRIRAMHTGLCISVCHSTNRIILLVSYFLFAFHFLETQPNVIPHRRGRATRRLIFNYLRDTSRAHRNQGVALIGICRFFSPCSLKRNSVLVIRSLPGATVLIPSIHTYPSDAAINPVRPTVQSLSRLNRGV